MNTLSLKLLPSMQFKPEVEIDGKKAKFKKNEFGSYVCKYQTENKAVRIKVHSYLTVGGFSWFVINLLLFVISVFGLFDKRPDKNCVAVSYSARVNVAEDTQAVLKMNSFTANTATAEKAVSLETDSLFAEDENRFYYDPTAKKKQKALTVCKVILTGALLVVLALIIF